MQTLDRDGRVELIKVPLAVEPGRQPARPGQHAGYPPRRFRRQGCRSRRRRLRARDAELVGERHRDSCQLCYVRGPEGISNELAERIMDRSWPGEAEPLFEAKRERRLSDRRD